MGPDHHPREWAELAHATRQRRLVGEKAEQDPAAVGAQPNVAASRIRSAAAGRRLRSDPATVGGMSGDHFAKLRALADDASAADHHVVVGPEGRELRGQSGALVEEGQIQPRWSRSHRFTVTVVPSMRP